MQNTHWVCRCEHWKKIHSVVENKCPICGQKQTSARTATSRMIQRYREQLLRRKHCPSDLVQELLQNGDIRYKTPDPINSDHVMLVRNGQVVMMVYPRMLTIECQHMKLLHIVNAPNPLHASVYRFVQSIVRTPILQDLWNHPNSERQISYTDNVNSILGLNIMFPRTSTRIDVAALHSYAIIKIKLFNELYPFWYVEDQNRWKIDQFYRGGYRVADLSERRWEQDYPYNRPMTA